MNSVLTYSVEPGHMLSAMAQQMYYGRTASRPKLTSSTGCVDAPGEVDPAVGAPPDVLAADDGRGFS